MSACVRFCALSSSAIKVFDADRQPKKKPNKPDTPNSTSPTHPQHLPHPSPLLWHCTLSFCDSPAKSSLALSSPISTHHGPSAALPLQLYLYFICVFYTVPLCTLSHSPSLCLFLATLAQCQRTVNGQLDALFALPFSLWMSTKKKQNNNPNWKFKWPKTQQRQHLQIPYTGGERGRKSESEMARGGERERERGTAL